MDRTSALFLWTRPAARQQRIGEKVVVFAFALLCVALPLVSCSESHPVPSTPSVRDKTTSPVTGRVLVNGEPADHLLVNCHPAGESVELSVRSLGLTDADGVITFSTFEASDGVPPGQYLLTFTWQEWDDYWNRHEGPDKLGGRYSESKQSTFQLIVKENETTDLGTIELTTE